MANLSLVAFAALFLVLFPNTALGDTNVTDICSEIECGKGTCKTNTSYIPHGYKCECDSGWKRTRLPDSEEQYLQFLPCIVPNCSINYSCMPAPPPLPPLPTSPYNAPIFDPCNWVYCGEGTCKNSSHYNQTCECQPGAYNLFNISHFPCYSDCALGSDCAKLGISFSKTSLTEGPTSGPASGPSVSLTSKGVKDVVHSWKLNWVIVTMVSLALRLWR